MTAPALELTAHEHGGAVLRIPANVITHFGGS